MKKLIIIPALFVLLVFLFSCEKKVSRSVPIAPKPIGAKLIISSIPEGAKIYLNGRTSGLVTPDSLTWLEVKEYKVTLKKELYRDTSFTVNVTEDSVRNILINMNNNPKMWGGIDCQSTPDKAKIFLNGKFTGRLTPAILDSLIPGRYLIKYTKKNTRPDSMIAIVTSGKISLAKLALVDTTFWVDYNTHTSGIFSESYSKITIDKQNIIWLGSLSGGIVKFDGKTWTQYTKKNSGLINNTINELKAGPNNHLWICTPNGLSEFDGTNWKNYTKDDQNGLPSNSINDIAFEPDGSPMVATNNGLAHLNNNSWEITVFNLNLPDDEKENQNYFTGIDIDNSGKIWAVRLQNGIAYWDGNKWSQYFTKFNQEINDPNIYYEIVRIAQNEVWFAHSIRSTQNATIGLSSYSNGSFDKVSYSQFFFSSITSIEIRNGNEKWISVLPNAVLGIPGGLYRFTNYPDLTRYAKGLTPLVTNQIMDVAFDSKGDAWIVTLSDGIYHFKISKK